MEALSEFLEAAMRAATPLLLAALGETLAERAGVINLGLEGAMLSGALAGFIGAAVLGPDLAWLAAAGAGVMVGVVFAFFVVTLRANQIIVGTAVTILALGVTGYVYAARYGSEISTPLVATSPALVIPGLSNLPLIGRAIFAQPVVCYVALALVPLVWWGLYHTHVGLALRAVGENVAAARAAGMRDQRIRWSAIVCGAGLGGVAGGALVLAQAGTFAEGMSAGRGFIAVAIVALGRWHPAGVLVATLLFGAANALQYLFQSLALTLPYQLFLALPYVLTLAALAGVVGRHRAPAALGMTESSP